MAMAAPPCATFRKSNRSRYRPRPKVEVNGKIQRTAPIENNLKYSISARVRLERMYYQNLWESKEA
jgi:hypothetical protein